jgi:hypothetical protein
MHPVSTYFLGGKLSDAPKRPGMFRMISTTYVFVQIVTGVEVGFAAVVLVVAFGWELPMALAVTIPTGFPVMLMQGYLATRYFRDPDIWAEASPPQQ